MSLVKTLSPTGVLVNINGNPWDSAQAMEDLVDEVGGGGGGGVADGDTITGAGTEEDPLVARGLSGDEGADMSIANYGGDNGAGDIYVASDNAIHVEGFTSVLHLQPLSGGGSSVLGAAALVSLAAPTVNVGPYSGVPGPAVLQMDPHCTALTVSSEAELYLEGGDANASALDLQDNLALLTSSGSGFVNLQGGTIVATGTAGVGLNCAGTSLVMTGTPETDGYAVRLDVEPGDAGEGFRLDLDGTEKFSITQPTTGVGPNVSDRAAFTLSGPDAYFEVTAGGFFGAKIVCQIVDTGGGSENRIRVQADKIGFFSTAPAAKPTGVAVTAAAIHAALVTLGLIAA